MYQFGNVVRHVWPPAKCLVCGRNLQYVHGKEVRVQGQTHLIAGYTCAHHTTQELAKVPQTQPRQEQTAAQQPARREEAAVGAGASRGQRPPRRNAPPRPRQQAQPQPQPQSQPQPQPQR
ncbi:MAG: hypothetical protein HY681_02360 [Chloroflexi bacterium]|nr:hypothetical protein [Chloroflexota bacterium]